MELPGPAEFGDPCNGCAFSWTASIGEIASLHARVHRALDAVSSAEFHVSAATLAWSVGEYICHIGDNERIWAERFAAINGDGRAISVAPFDQDKLAAARNYPLIDHASAMWSLRRAFQDFTDTSQNALRKGGALRHPERGELSALDAVRTVVHDCHHHLWDIQCILAEREAGTPTS